MLPDVLYLRGDGNELRLADAIGVRAKTNKNIEIRADGPVSIHAGTTLTFRTPEQLRIAKTGVDSGINVARGQLHIKSKTVLFRGDPSKPVSGTFPVKTNPQTTIDAKLALATLGMLPWE